MSTFIKFVDEGMKSAVFTKFQSHFELVNEIQDIVFAPKETAQRMVAEKRGEGTVEFISLWRERLVFDWGRQNTAIARKGLMMQYTDDIVKDEIINIKAVPVKMAYNIWFWSRNLDKMNQALESYLFWIHSYPNLILNYQGIYPMELYIKPGEAVDESNYAIYDKGKYFVNRLPVQVDGWILSSVNAKTILTVILDIFLREGQPPVDTLVATHTITVDDASSTLTVPKYPEESNV